MMRQSSSRIHRNRGWKVKHVLQICILATVCVWLIYQVKHSHERRSSSEDLISKPTEVVEEIRPDNLKLGRKDPQEKTVPLATEVSEELEEVEDKSEQEQEKLEEDGEDLNEVDHEGSEIEGEDGEGEEKDSVLSEIEEADEKSQEAREENYKADDVSSAVSKDVEEEAQEFSKEQQIKGQDAPEDGVAANLTDIITEEEHHDNSSSPNEGLVIGPPPNSTDAIISPGSIVDHNDTSSSAFSDLLKEASSNSTTSVSDNSTVQESSNQFDLGNSTVHKHDNETFLGNSTISDFGNRTDLGDSLLTEHVNSTTSIHENLIVDPGNQFGNSSQRVSTGNNTQLTETRKSESETVNVSTPVVDESKTTEDAGSVDYDALHHQMEAPKVRDGADEDEGVSTKGKAAE